MKKRHLLHRKCIVCGMKDSKSKMYRLVVNDERECVIDRVGTFPGRGAYLCNNAKCWSAAQLNKRVTIALRTPAGLMMGHELRLFTSELHWYVPSGE